MNPSSVISSLLFTDVGVAMVLQSPDDEGLGLTNRETAIFVTELLLKVTS
jgi:hypothetical protein